MMTAGVRPREDGGAAFVPAAGVWAPEAGAAGVWARAIDQSATKEITARFDLNFIWSPFERGRKRERASNRSGRRRNRNLHVQPVFAAGAAGHGWRQHLRRWS